MLLFYRLFQKWFICYVVLLALLTICQLENREPAEIISLSSEELKGLQQAFPKVDSSTAAKHFTQNHIIIIEMLEENLGEMCLSNI